MKIYNNISASPAYCETVDLKNEQLLSNEIMEAALTGGDLKQYSAPRAGGCYASSCPTPSLPQGELRSERQASSLPQANPTLVAPPGGNGLGKQEATGGWYASLKASKANPSIQKTKKGCSLVVCRRLGAKRLLVLPQPTLLLAGSETTTGLFIKKGPLLQGIRSFASSYKGSAVSSTFTSSALKKAIKSLIGRPLNPHTFLHYNTKSVVYSFNKVNKLNPLFIAASTEYLLKSIFLSMFSLISRPVFVIKHDKIIIRLFVFLSPKIDKYLDTSTYFGWANNSKIKVPVPSDKTGGGGAVAPPGSSRFSSAGANTTKQVGIPSANLKRLFRTAVGVKYIALKKFLKFKSLRAKPVEILNSQIKLQLLAGVPCQEFTCCRAKAYATTGKGTIDHVRMLQAKTPSLVGQVVAQLALGLAPSQRKVGLASLATPTLLASACECCQPALSLPQNKTIGGLLLLPLRDKAALSQEASRQEEEANAPNLKLGTSVANPTNTYTYTSWVSNFKKTLEKLSVIFGKIFNKKVEFEIIKAQLPYQDSKILAQILGNNADKYKFRRMLKILIPRAVIKNPSKELTPNYLKTEGFGSGLAAGPVWSSSASTALREGAVAGMNIKLAGRLMTQSIRPRFTVQSLQEGSLARVKVHFIEKSRFTGKNKRGAFSFTVTISHVFNQ